MRWRLTALLLAVGWLVPNGTGLFGQDDPFQVGDGTASPFVTHPEFAGELVSSGSWIDSLRDEFRPESLPDEPWDWHLLPEGLMYKSYLAGPKEPRLSTAFLHEVGGETLWDSTLGGRVGLARYGTVRGVQPEGFQIDVEGAAMLRMQPQQERDVMSVDFRAGVPLTYREGPFQVKLAYYHISSHVGDEYLLANPGFQRNNYSRDAFVLGGGWFAFDSLRFYAELGWSFYGTGGDKPWEFQTGFEWSSNRPTGIRGEPYLAVNAYFRESVDWNGSLNVMAGWQWRSRESDHLFRTGLQYFNGPNSQYVFLRDNQQLIGLGINYDY